MELKLTQKQFRRLLDLVYIGNWVLNSTRGDDRIKEYDEVESRVFAHCLDHGMAKLVQLYEGELIPSRAFAEGGIHEAIMAYEDIAFFEILAEEMALRDLGEPTRENYDAILDRVELADHMGVCLDTCHVNDAGYDIVNDLYGVLTEFDHVIGLDRLKAIHINDSLNPLGARKDRHAKIGEGFIGTEAFGRIIRHPALRDLPFVLETPNELPGYATEIALLREIRGE